MVEYIVSLLFVVFVILWIMDFFTTEYVLKLGGYEKSLLLKYVAGQPIPHAIVKIIVIIVVFFIKYIINMMASPYLTNFFTLLLIILILGLAYAQINNIILISSKH